ncbi:hypothetical protein HD806DRAFT_542564 [Xylariaceae sp. AK1471]|nr:hypothetical protein HD806DRAFT_542564 [Xylariaceae sp. AK1471]
MASLDYLLDDSLDSLSDSSSDAYCDLNLKPFPEPNFPFGGGIQIDARQRLTYQAQFRKIKDRIELPGIFLTPEEDKEYMRKVVHTSALGIDDGFFSGYTNAMDYWMAVLDEIPPRPWVKVNHVLQYLSRVPPYLYPSRTKLWELAINWLDKAQQIGSAAKWTCENNLAIGLGWFPSFLEAKIVRTGCAWLFVEPKYRVLPSLWTNYARQHGLAFSGALPVRTEIVLETGATTSSSQVQPATSKVQDVPFKGPFAKVDELAKQSKDQLSEEGWALRARAETFKRWKFVDVQTARDPTKLADVEAAANANVKALLDGLSDLDAFVGSIAKFEIYKSLFHGVIEGRAREIIEETHRNAGMSDEEGLGSTITNHVKEMLRDQPSVLEGKFSQVLTSVLDLRERLDIIEDDLKDLKTQLRDKKLSQVGNRSMDDVSANATQIARPIANASDRGTTGIPEERTVSMANIIIEDPFNITLPPVAGPPTPPLVASSPEPFFLAHDWFQIPKNREIDPDETEYSSSPSAVARPSMGLFFPLRASRPGRPFLAPERVREIDPNETESDSPPSPAPRPPIGFFRLPVASRPSQPPNRPRTPRSREIDPYETESGSPPSLVAGPRMGLFPPPAAYRPGNQPILSSDRFRTPGDRETDPDKTNSSSPWQITPSTGAITSSSGFADSLDNSPLFPRQQRETGADKLAFGSSPQTSPPPPLPPPRTPKMSALPAPKDDKPPRAAHPRQQREYKPLTSPPLHPRLTAAAETSDFVIPSSPPSVAIFSERNSQWFRDMSPAEGPWPPDPMPDWMVVDPSPTRGVKRARKDEEDGHGCPKR